MKNEIEKLNESGKNGGRRIAMCTDNVLAP